MSIEAMNHFTVLTDDVDATCTFYGELFGLRIGPRPAFTFPGAWLYVGDTAILHVVGGRHRDELRAGVLDHMAFSARDLRGVVGRLRERGIAFSLRRLAGRDEGPWQLFCQDPNGAKVELDFDASEPAPADAP